MFVLDVSGFAVSSASAFGTSGAKTSECGLNKASSHLREEYTILTILSKSNTDFDLKDLKCFKILSKYILFNI